MADGGAVEARGATRFTNEYFTKYGNKTFSNLFNAYGYSFPNPADNMSTPNIAGSIIQNGYNVIAAPFSFARIGHIALQIGSLRSVGLY